MKTLEFGGLSREKLELCQSDIDANLGPLTEKSSDMMGPTAKCMDNGDAICPLPRGHTKFFCSKRCDIITSKVGKMPANKHICHASGIYREIMANKGKYWQI